MLLSRRGRALLTIRRSQNDLPRQLARLVAAAALTESLTLDRVWAADTHCTCCALTKRRHRQFQRALLAFFYCVTGDYLRTSCPNVNARFLDALAREVCQAALYDPVLRRPPYFQSDVPETLRDRYSRKISEQRSRWVYRDNVFLPQALIHHTVQTLITDAGVSPSTAKQLESVLPARLEWTSKQLLGN